MYNTLGFTQVPKDTRIRIDNVILKPRNPRIQTHMYAPTRTLTKRLATVDTNHTHTSHAKTAAQIPKMTKLLIQMELHHGASDGDNMDIDYVLRASDMTFLSWAPACTSPNPTYTLPHIYSLITDDPPDTSHPTTYPLVDSGTDMEHILNLLNDSDETTPDICSPNPNLSHTLDTDHTPTHVTVHPAPAQANPTTTHDTASTYASPDSDPTHHRLQPRSRSRSRARSRSRSRSRSHSPPPANHDHTSIPIRATTIISTLSIPITSPPIPSINPTTIPYACIVPPDMPWNNSSTILYHGWAYGTRPRFQDVVLVFAYGI